MICPMCETYFEQVAHNQRFCSERCKNRNSKRNAKQAGMKLHGTEKIYRIADTLPEDYDMLGVTYDSMTLKASLELGSLPPYALVELQGRFYDVVETIGRNGGRTQKLVEQESLAEIVCRRVK